MMHPGYSHSPQHRHTRNLLHILGSIQAISYRHLHCAAAAAPRPTACQYFYNLHPLWPLAPLLAPAVSGPPPLLTSHTCIHTCSCTLSSVDNWDQLLQGASSLDPAPLLLPAGAASAGVALASLVESESKVPPLLLFFPFLYSYPPACPTCAHW